MAGQKYWKILLVVMVITCENIGFITRGLRPLVINPIFSLVMTITTHNIFKYFLPAIYHYTNVYSTFGAAHPHFLFFFWATTFLYSLIHYITLLLSILKKVFSIKVSRRLCLWVGSANLRKRLNNKAQESINKGQFWNLSIKTRSHYYINFLFNFSFSVFT